MKLSVKKLVPVLAAFSMVIVYAAIAAEDVPSMATEADDSEASIISSENVLNSEDVGEVVDISDTDILELYSDGETHILRAYDYENGDSYFEELQGERVVASTYLNAETGEMVTQFYDEKQELQVETDNVSNIAVEASASETVENEAEDITIEGS